MKTFQKLAVGAAAGTAALVAASRVLRQRRAIDFAGRVVVITGGSRGLGLVMARQFAAEGARLCLLARDADELARARAELANPEAVMTVVCDIRREADARAAIDEVLERWTAVDVLVNNAGVIQVGPFEHVTVEDFEKAMATHFWGPLYLMMAAIPTMRRRGFGRIVNVASIGGKVALPHLAPYCSSKFALVGLSDSVRAELDRHGIRVTTVCPGLMRTGSPMNAEIKGKHEAEYAWFAISDSIPGLSTSAERAACRIIEACRYGDPDLTITLPAQLAVAVNNAMPTLVARATALTNRVLPSPAGASGDITRRGRESESAWAPSLATALTDRAAVNNNEV